MKRVKFILFCIVALALFLSGAFLMYRHMSRTQDSDPLPEPITKVVEQGKEVALPGIGKKPVFDDAPPDVVVKTEVKKGDLSQLISTHEERQEQSKIEPDQAIVKQEVDTEGNTIVTIWTPVNPDMEEERPDQILPDWSPIESIRTKDENELSEEVAWGYPGDSPQDYIPIDDLPEDENERPDHFSGQLDKGEEWYYVETKVVIPAQKAIESRLKPALIMSLDEGKIALEAGLVYELWRLEKRPLWMSKEIYNVVERVSIDGMASVYRAGAGVSVRAIYKSKAGIGVSLEWTDFIKQRPDPQLGFEAVIYGTWSF